MRWIARVWCRLTYRTYDFGFVDHDPKRVRQGEALMQHRRAHIS